MRQLEDVRFDIHSTSFQSALLGAGLSKRTCILTQMLGCMGAGGDGQAAPTIVLEELHLL